MKFKKESVILFGALLFVLYICRVAGSIPRLGGVGVGWKPSTNPPPALRPTPPERGIASDHSSRGAVWHTVTRVVDGDTIVIDTGEKVRYIGMNTPETVDPRRPVECFGKEASVENKKLVEGKKVRLEKDISDKDRYGRLLRFVYLEDGTFVNLKLVQDGFANVMTVPPDVAKVDIFLAAQRKAREEGRGLWAVCK